MGVSVVLLLAHVVHQCKEYVVYGCEQMDINWRKYTIWRILTLLKFVNIVTYECKLHLR